MAKENLHRRKARAVEAAKVMIGADNIMVVVPEIVGKNSSHTGGRNGLRFVSAHTKAFRQSVESGINMFRTACAFGEYSEVDYNLSRIEAGAWRLEVLGVWPTQNHRVGFIAPNGDADAAIPQALDALQHAGILDDDARVVEVRAWNMYRKGVRATVVRLVRVHDLIERERDIVHLLPLVPTTEVDEWPIGTRCHVAGEGDDVFEVVEARGGLFPTTVYLTKTVGRRRIDHGRESVSKLTPAVKRARKVKSS